MKKDITIYDIAKEFGVSASTVSRALKGHKSIGKKRTAEIKKYAEEMGYQVNSFAAKLRQQNTFTLGVVVTWINQPFFSSMISGIESIARSKGYNVIISQTHDKQDLEKEIVHNMLNSRVEGLIISLAIETEDFSHFEPFKKRGIPIVFVDRVPTDLVGDKVIIDNFESAFKATEHLIQQGNKRIGHITGKGKFIFQQRKAGYLAALEKYGLTVEEELIVSAPSLNEENSIDMARTLLTKKNRPDAIFAAIDSTAVSTILLAKEMGIKVPEQLAVVGFNNDPIASVVDPPLTTISQPPVMMGKIAAEHVLNITEHAPEVITLDTELIIRGSSVKTSN
ncbi:LacI family DNA-binding transcriptional regulator [Marinoscillum pacificum]|uniref:LacI family DNA-binding transcriptional regulator n=1 Tax=Marinoscillum pacificum TaxID=392723 RepID=UPI002158273E|nr:LacI family DNA-binding transcriptional regulator [Marinoscillum pacificum]